MLNGDFLAAGPAITQRLTDAAPGLRHVLSAADLEGVQEQRQRHPAAHVLFTGYSLAQSQPEAARAIFRQTWVVVVVERNVTQADQVAHQHEAIGPLVTEALQALMGWRPTEHHSPLAPTDSPFQTAYSSGFVYVPLAFTTDIKIAGEAR